MKYTWLHTNARVVHNCTQTKSSKRSEPKNVGAPENTEIGFLYINILEGLAKIGFNKKISKHERMARLSNFLQEGKCLKSIHITSLCV